MNILKKEMARLERLKSTSAFWDKITVIIGVIVWISSHSIWLGLMAWGLISIIHGVIGAFLLSKITDKITDETVKI